MEKSKKITKDMRLSEVMREHPKTAFVFIDHGLPCVGCHLVEDDTVEGAAKLHGVDLDKLLKDLNKAVKED